MLLPIAVPPAAIATANPPDPINAEAAIVAPENKSILNAIFPFVFHKPLAKLSFNNSLFISDSICASIIS